MKTTLQNLLSGKSDIVAVLTTIVVLSATWRFLFDGVTLELFGHSLTVGHMDPMAYGSLLTPILGAHAYSHVRGKNGLSRRGRVDNPDDPYRDTIR